MVMEMHCFTASLERGCYEFKGCIYSKIRLRFSNWKIIFKGFCLTSGYSNGGGSSIDEGKIFLWLIFIIFLIEKLCLPLSQDRAHAFLSLSLFEVLPML